METKSRKDHKKRAKGFGKAEMKARLPVSVGRRRILAIPAHAQGEQQLRKMQPMEIDQAPIICINARNKRHEECNIWEREFEIRRPTDDAGSTETLFALINCKFTGTCQDDDTKHTIGLYSPRERCGYRLPPIPGHATGIPLLCQCVSLDGKLYILGGDSSDSDLTGSNKVYVINLRGKNLVKGEGMQWEECPSMLHPRVKFGVGVIEGKIYVFGGISMSDCIRECEVYDPTKGPNGAWSLIKPMPSSRHSHSVVAVGKELYVHGGEVLDFYDFDGEDGPPDSHDGTVQEAEDGLTDPDGRNDYDAEDWSRMVHLYDISDEEAEAQIIDASGSTDDEADFGPEPDPTLLEAYDAVHDGWRVVEDWMKHSSDALFVAEERVYAMDAWSISRLETPDWVHFAECPITTSRYRFGPDLSAVVHPFATEAQDGIRERGLVVLVSWYNISTGQYGQAVVQSEQFSERSLIEWELAASFSHYVPLSSVVVAKPFFCRIDL